MITPASDAKYAELIRKRYESARTLFQPVADRVEINRNLYKGIMSLDDQYEWDYSLVDQQVFPLIRNYIARSNPSQLKVRLEARKPDDFERRQINQDFVNWEINELPLTSLMVRGFFSNYITGRAYYKSGWKYDPRVVIKNGRYMFEMRPLINRADLKFVKFTNIIPSNRNIPSIYEQPYYFELTQLRIGDMLKDNETYGFEYWDKVFLEKVKKYGIKAKPLDYEADFVTDSDTSSKDMMAYMSATFPAACMHTLEGDVMYIPLVDGVDEIINKKRDNIYWHGHYPIIEQVAFPEDDEYFSMSVVDAVGDTQIASTEVLNQTLTNARSLNNNMWIVGASQEAVPDYMFKQRPSGVIRTPGATDEIVSVRPNDGVSSLLRVNQDLNTKFERIGGISSLYSSGSASSKSVNLTARGAQIIDQNIETNIKMIFDLFGEQVLKTIGDHFLSLNPQYVTEEQTFAVTGKKNVRELLSISPDQISANFDVYTMPEAMIKQTPASRQASLQNMITTINREAAVAGITTDMTPLFQSLIDSYPEMENIDDIVVSVDEKSKRDISMMERGQMPEIKIRDMHMPLIQAVSIHFEENQLMYTPEVTELFKSYVQKHLQYLQSEQQIQMLSAPQIPMASSPDALAQSFGASPSGEIPETMGTTQPEMYDLGMIVRQGGGNG